MKRAPNYIKSKKARTWYSKIHGEFNITDSFQLEMIEKATNCLDRIEKAKEEIATDGISIKTRDGGKKTHPAIAIERDYRGTDHIGVKIYAKDGLSHAWGDSGAGSG